MASWPASSPRWELTVVDGYVGQVGPDFPDVAELAACGEASQQVQHRLTGARGQRCGDQLVSFERPTRKHWTETVDDLYPRRWHAGTCSHPGMTGLFADKLIISSSWTSGGARERPSDPGFATTCWAGNHTAMRTSTRPAQLGDPPQAREPWRRTPPVTSVVLAPPVDLARRLSRRSPGVELSPSWDVERSQTAGS